MTKIVSLDGTSLNSSTYRSFFIQSYGIGGRSATYVGQADGRPALSALGVEPRYLPALQVVIEDGAAEVTARRTLHALFFQDDTTPKRLIVTDDDGGNERYWDVVVEAFDQVPGTAGMAFVASMRAVDDNALRGTTPGSASKTVTTSPDTLAVNNTGDVKSYPVISLTPNTAKTGTWQYRRFVTMRWNSTQATSRFPVDVADIWDTTALVSGGKMQADGRDIRVLVNGVLVEPYVANPNSTTTKVWVALDFAPYADLTLATAIASTGAVTTIDVNEDISGYPTAGLLVIGSEIFSYTNRNTVLKQFSGVTRAERGSSMAAHAASSTVWLCQNDVWILYGHNGTLPALAPSDLYRPAFDLAASTNLEWQYNADDFGDNVGYRPAAWRFNRLSGVSEAVYAFTDEGGADIDPWDVIGLSAWRDGNAEWRLSVPVGCSYLSIVGQKYRTPIYGTWDAWVTMTHRTEAGASTQFTPIPAPAQDDVWEGWSALPSSLTVAKTEVGFRLGTSGSVSGDYSGRSKLYVSSADVTLLNPPTFAMYPEQTVYSLDARLTNLATGDVVALRYDMAIGDTLIVDTATRRVYLASGKSAFSGLSMSGARRAEWLPLLPGSNTLRYEETGVTSLGLQVSFSPRYVF